MEFKGINRNVPYSKMPVGFGADAKNGNNSLLDGVSSNEGGFKIFQKVGTASTKKYNLTFTLGGVSVVRRQIGEVELDLNRTLIISLIYKQGAGGGSGDYPPVASEIGMLSEEGEYNTIINDFTFSSANKLKFTAANPVTGEYTKNYLQELIVALTDGNTSPYLINIDYFIANPPTSGFDINLIKMFPSVNEVNVLRTVNDSGGNLDNGVYYFGIDYVNKDFSVSGTTLLTNPVSVFSNRVGSTFDNNFKNVSGDTTPTKTSKSIILNVSGINTSFDYISVRVFVKRNGVVNVVRLTDIPITGSTMTINVTSNEGTTISLAEAITPKVKFKTVGKFTQVYNRLYAAKTEVNGLRGLQATACEAKVQWVTTKVNPFTDGKTIKEQEKTFLHKEVYALNLHAVLLDGTITEGFTIPWNHGDPEAYDLEGSLGVTNLRETSVLANTQGLTMARYEIEDTIPEPAIVVNKGNTGYWENKNEVYPNLAEFGSFAGEPVRHHRMPSINFMARQYNDSVYGVTALDKLDIEVTNVNIPNDLKPFIKNWFITYAQRSVGECTVLGQSTTYLQSTALADGGASDAKKYTDVEKPTWSSGSNFIVEGNPSYTVYPVSPWFLNFSLDAFCDETLIRFYDLNLLVNQPSVSPVYIANELHYKVKIDFSDLVLGADTDNHNANVTINNIEGKVDGSYMPIVRHDVNNIDTIDVRYRAVKDYRYLLNNTIDGRFDNRYQEDCLLLEIDSTLSNPIPNDAVFSVVQSTNPTSGQGANGQFAFNTSTFDVFKKEAGAWVFFVNRRKDNRSFPMSEDADADKLSLNWLYANSSWGDHFNMSYLTTLMANPSDLYKLTNQKLVSTGILFDVNADTGLIENAGDGFTTFNSFHAAGWGGTRSNKLLEPSSTEEELQRCFRSLWAFLCESQVNNQLRGYDETNTNTQFYPKATSYFTGTDRFNIATNKLYNNDYTSINNLIPLQPYNYKKTLLTKNEFRINRTVPQESENLDFGWRTWLVNDYYEVARNKGAITTIEGQDRDLFIQTEKSLFKTVGNEQLNIDSTTAFIGAGNIFERPAIEFIPSREGALGSRDMFSCRVTKFGYVSVDRETKSINLVVGNSAISLSDDTLFLWLSEALDYSTKVFYTSTAFIEVPADNPYVSKGIHVGLDPKYKRLLITKRDFELTSAGKAAVVAGTLLYTNNRWILLGSPAIREISDTDTTYFKQLGWTVAYEIANKSFTFFQDYVPNKYFSTRFDIFASCLCISATALASVDSRIFIMNQENFGVYSNTVNLNVDSPVTETAAPFPFFIMPVFGFDKQSYQLLDARFQTDVLDTASTLGTQARYQNEPPTSILVFNSYQSTPVVTLVPFGTNPANFFTYNTRNIKGVWYFNNKLNNWLADNIFNTGAAFITNFSNLDVSKIDAAKPKFNVLPLIDQWFAIKILYNNQIVGGKSKEFRILHVDILATPVNR